MEDIVNRISKRMLSDAHFGFPGITFLQDPTQHQCKCGPEMSRSELRMNAFDIVEVFHRMGAEKLKSTSNKEKTMIVVIFVQQKVVEVVVLSTQP